MLACYERIGSAARRMADAARAGDWARVRAGVADCEHHIRRLGMIGEPDAVLDAAGQARRFQILRGILADDARIRECAQPGLARIERFLRGEGRHAPASDRD
jgi:flagellar protein FliT